VWAEAFFHAHHKDHIELQALGRMQRQQSYGIRLILEFIHVGDERHLFQEGRQRLAGRECVVALYGTIELTDVENALLAFFRPISERVEIAAILDHQPQHRRE